MPRPSPVAITVTTAPAVPDAPLAVVASEITGSSLELSWQDETFDGAPITSYFISVDGTLAGTADATNFARTDLAHSTTYSFSVAAEAAYGDSPQTQITATTSLATPGPPTQLTQGGTTATAESLSWQAATIAGGGAVSDYVIYENNAAVALSDTSSATIIGLASATTDSFTVAAEGAASISAPGTATSVIASLATPDAPSVLTTGNVTGSGVFFTQSNALVLPNGQGGDGGGGEGNLNGDVAARPASHLRRSPSPTGPPDRMR